MQSSFISRAFLSESRRKRASMQNNNFAILARKLSIFCGRKKKGANILHDIDTYIKFPRARYFYRSIKLQIAVSRHADGMGKRGEWRTKVEESKTGMDQVRFENCGSDRYGYRPAIQSAKFPRMAGNKALCILQGPCNDTART